MRVGEPADISKFMQCAHLVPAVQHIRKYVYSVQQLTAAGTYSRNILILPYFDNCNRASWSVADICWTAPLVQFCRSWYSTCSWYSWYSTYVHVAVPAGTAVHAYQLADQRLMTSAGHQLMTGSVDSATDLITVGGTGVYYMSATVRDESRCRTAVLANVAPRSTFANTTVGIPTEYYVYVQRA